MKNLLFILTGLSLVLACHSPQNRKADARGNVIKDGRADEAFYYAPPAPQKPGYDQIKSEESHPGDRYTNYGENPFMEVENAPVSTFSIDADGASYANIRRYLQENNQLPPSDAVRIEEMVNYFDMGYDFGKTDEAISLNGEMSTCPWNKAHKLVRIGIQGKPMARRQLPAANYVFLIDVSGSMSSEDKLEMLKGGFLSFVDKMRSKDKIAIVTYAGSAGLALPSTPGSDKATIKKAIRKLGSGGSTAGAAGILTAYEIAEANFIEGGNNRIILGTDGDFNVGISNMDELVKLIEKKRESGIFLTVLGVGRGNLYDAMLEQIANHGNGNYEYIDCIDQLQKVFVHDASRFFSVAKDVKVQIHFSPQTVKSYRLIGYANRLLNEEDFEDDTKDAGEIGAGQSITALYEIVPAENPVQPEEILNIDFRYKAPDADVSKPLSYSLVDRGLAFEQASEQMRFAASVAAFGMILRNSEYKAEANYEDVLTWSKGAMGYDPGAYREEFRKLVGIAKGI